MSNRHAHIHAKQGLKSSNLVTRPESQHPSDPVRPAGQWHRIRPLVSVSYFSLLCCVVVPNYPNAAPSLHQFHNFFDPQPPPCDLVKPPGFLLAYPLRAITLLRCRFIRLIRRCMSLFSLRLASGLMFPFANLSSAKIPSGGSLWRSTHLDLELSRGCMGMQDVLTLHRAIFDRLSSCRLFVACDAASM